MNDFVDLCDWVVVVVGGLFVEVIVNWCMFDVGIVDVEFGFFCMGYEIVGVWGVWIV